MTEYSEFFAHPARERDIAVVLLDHVPKESSGSARGSGRKKDEVDVQWELVNDKAFDRSTTGLITLKRHKDREGWLPKNVEFEVGGKDGRFIFRRVGAQNPHHRGLSPKQQKVLAVLEDTFGVAGAEATAWQKACKGIPSSTFYDDTNWLSGARRSPV